MGEKQKKKYLNPIKRHGKKERKPEGEGIPQKRKRDRGPNPRNGEMCPK